MKRLFVLLAFFVVLIQGCEVLDLEEFTRNDEFQTSVMSARDELRMSNVTVKAEFSHTIILPTPSFEAQGSGVIFASEEGTHYVLTNHHVVDPGDRPYSEYAVHPFDTEDPIEAKLIDKDVTRDLAVLAFEDDASYETLDIFERKGDSLRRGEFVLAVGSPSAVDSIVTFGEFDRMVAINDVDFDVIAHCALIYPGSSGGALADADGNLIGINTWSAKNSDTNMSVPLDEVHDYLDSLEMLEFHEDIE